MNPLARALPILFVGALALATGGAGVFAAVKLATTTTAEPQADPEEELAQAPETSEPPPPIEPVDEPRYVEMHGLTLQDEPHVWGLLEASVRCRTWMGQSTDHHASVMDLLRLRRRGYASLPAEYRVLHERRDGYDYVLIYERLKQRDGSEIAGMPGFVQHRYLYDAARERFEHLRSTPEDPNYRADLLRALQDPITFLTLHWDAVCNGRLSLPEVRAEMAARREARKASEATAAAAAESGALDSGEPTPEAGSPEIP